MNLSSRKIALVGFIGLVALALLTNTLSFFRGTSLLQQISNEYKRPFELMEDLGKLQSSFATMELALRDLSNAHDSLEVVSSKAKAEYALDQLRETTRVLRKDTVYKELISSVYPLSEDIRAKLDYIEVLNTQGRREESYDLALSYSEYLNEESNQIIKRIEPRTIQIANDIYKQSETKIKDFLWFIFTMILGFLIGGSIMTYLFYARIRSKEREIIEEKNNFKLLFEKSPHAIYLNDLDGNILDANTAAQKSSGYTKNELLMRTVMDLDKKYSSKETCHELWNGLNEGQSASFESEHRTKSGGSIHVEVDFTPIRLKEMGPITILAQVRDTTDKKIAEINLQESEMRYRRLVDSAPALLYEFNIKEGVGIYYSHQVHSIFGYSAEYMVEHPTQWADSVHPDDLPKIKESIEAFKNGNPFQLEYRIKHKSGQWRWINDRSINHGPSSDIIQGLAFDVTNRKIAELELNEANRQLLLIIQNIPGAVFSCTKAKFNKISFVSDFFEKITGYPKADLMENKISFNSITHPSDLLKKEQIIEESFQNHTRYSLIYRLLSKTNETKWVQEIGEFESASNKVFGILFDLTDKIKTEEEKLKLMIDATDAERARMSHELHDGVQQDLVSALLNFESLKEQINTLGEKETHRFETALRILNKGLEEIRRIAHKLLPKHVEDFGLVGAVENMISNMDLRIKFSFTHTIHSSLNERIEINLYRIIQEALVNILKHSEATQVLINLNEHDKVLTLTFEDNGKGFDQSQMNTNKSYGILSMKSRANAMNAIFEISSSPGKGTFILVETPLTDELEFSNNKSTR